MRTERVEKNAFVGLFAFLGVPAVLFIMLLLVWGYLVGQGKALDAAPLLELLKVALGAVVGFGIGGAAGAKQ